MHWIYLIHEFHNLSWITKINELVHDILIYWDAPVCTILESNAGSYSTVNILYRKQEYMQSGALLRMVQIYLKAWLMSFHAYSMTGCSYVTLRIYCDGRMTVIIRRCVNLTETVQFLRWLQSGKYDQQNDKAITEMWPISASRHMLKQDQPVIQMPYIWHPFTLPTSHLFVRQLNWAENTKAVTDEAVDLY